VALSMALTPLIYAGASHFARRLEGIEAPSQFAPSRNTDQQVVIAGIARFGQCVGRILRGLNISFTAPEINPEHIAITRRFGTKAHYGDTSNLDLLRMAYLENARVIVIAIDDSDALICTAALVLQHFPQVETLARARDRQHAYRLLDLGVTRVERELLHSALHLTDQLLRTLGMSVQGTHRTIGAFRRNNLVAPNQAHAVYKD
jgi:voltage-gated potassium channel Kch